MNTPKSPMMDLYCIMRSKLPERTLLLFKLGDFYEAFFDDAKTVSNELTLTLTKRKETPMCGIPYHMMASCEGKLIKLGYKVAVADYKPATTKPILL
jgi:DNA mismatch repair protein MutS